MYWFNETGSDVKRPVAPMRLIHFATAAVAILGAITGGAVLWSQQTTRLRSENVPTGLVPISLRLNGPFDSSFAGEMVAARAGLFEREGLHIELKPGGVEADPIDLVAIGADAIGVVGADRFLLARGKGVPIVAFAAGYLESPIVFFVLNQSGIHTPRDFIGKRVHYQTEQDTAIIYNALMTRLRLPRINVHETSAGTDISSLINGKVDIWSGHIARDARESYRLQQQGIRYNIIRPADYGIHVPGTVYFTTEKTIRDHPALIRQFLRAVIAGWELVYADYAKSVPLIAAFDEKTLTLELVRFALEQQRDFIRPPNMRFAEFDDTRWKLLRDILLQQQLINNSIDMSKAVTFDFLREAYRKSISFGK